MTETPQTGTTRTSPTPRPPSVWPTFQADDALAMIDFLVDVVGFHRTAVYRDGDLVAHAQLDWPEGGGVMLGSRREGSAVAPGRASIYVVTDHVDEVHQRVSAAPGATITRPLSDTGYGSREFVLTDPEGNFWSFGTYRGEPAAP